MSKEIETGGSAFPGKFTGQGMTLRDYFATHASEDDVLLQAENLRILMIKTSGLAILPDDWRTSARYMHADEMLAARAKR